MEPEERKEEKLPQPGEDAPQEPEKKPYKPYSRKARLWAWVGIAFMVFLTIMYAYSFASGSILMF